VIKKATYRAYTHSFKPFTLSDACCNYSLKEPFFDIAFQALQSTIQTAILAFIYTTEDEKFFHLETDMNKQAGLDYVRKIMDYISRNNILDNFSHTCLLNEYLEHHNINGDTTNQEFRDFIRDSFYGISTVVIPCTYKGMTGPNDPLDFATVHEIISCFEDAVEIYKMPTRFIFVEFKDE
jgi:hypothetical protein